MCTFHVQFSVYEVGFHTAISELTDLLFIHPVSQYEIDVGIVSDITVLYLWYLK